MYICKYLYIFVYIAHIVKEQQKKKKKSHVLPPRDLIYGTEIIPLFPYLRAGL